MKKIIIVIVLILIHIPFCFAQLGYNEKEYFLNGKEEKPEPPVHHGMRCPGSAMREFNVSLEEEEKEALAVSQEVPSQLRQWPVQMHLVNPRAPYFNNAVVVLAADCVAFALGDFHKRFLKGKSLAIACPKLDQGKEVYIQKLEQMIVESMIQSLDVVVMEVPCCSGLLQMAMIAKQNAGRDIPIRQTVIGVDGRLVAENEY